MPEPILRRMSLLLAFAAALFLSLVCALSVGLADGAQDHVYVYAITDFHGHVEQGAKVAGVLDELRSEHESDGEADAVVALVHEGAEFLGGLSSDVDAVVAGHTHVIDTQTTDAGAPLARSEPSRPPRSPGPAEREDSRP